MVAYATKQRRRPTGKAYYCLRPLYHNVDVVVTLGTSVFILICPYGLRSMMMTRMLLRSCTTNYCCSCWSVNWPIWPIQNRWGGGGGGEELLTNDVRFVRVNRDQSKPSIHPEAMQVIESNSNFFSRTSQYQYGQCNLEKGEKGQSCCCCSLLAFDYDDYYYDDWLVSWIT